MANKVSERTLRPALVPSGPRHVHAVRSAGGVDSGKLLAFLGFASSLLADLQIRTSVGSEISGTHIERLPFAKDRSGLHAAIARRAARLACLTRSYASIWDAAFGESWVVDSPVRPGLFRRTIQIEIDCLIALSFDVDIDELCIVYRTQFPVLRGYEEKDLYDANGRKVPAGMNRFYLAVGEEGMAAEDLRWTHPQSQVEYTFEIPFRGFDREEDMRAAYAKFSRMLEDHGEIIEGEA
jgi:hypothetical protein